MTRCDRLQRRQFITLLGGAAVWPLAARAQQPALPVIGFLSSEGRNDRLDLTEAFHRGLSEGGYAESRNAAIEYRFAENQYDRLPALAADLVQRGVSVIAAMGSPAVTAAKAATTTIPIVFYVGVEPVSFGLVESLSRPGGNVTGVTNFSLEIGPKRLELLADLLGSRRIVGILFNPRRARSSTELNDLLQAAHALRLQPQVLYAEAEREF